MCYINAHLCVNFSVKGNAVLIEIIIPYFDKQSLKYLVLIIRKLSTLKSNKHMNNLK